MHTNQFIAFLFSIDKLPLRVIEPSFLKTDYVPIDLSKNNKVLALVDVSSSSKLEAYINTHIKNNNALVAFGGYNETRTLYKRSQHFKTDEVVERNIHIGIDLWCSEGTSVQTPLDGTVHSFKNNTNFGDYGPTIILKHTIDEVEFYTLYGHLTLESIKHLKINQVFKQGEKLATFGGVAVNGDYPPHLHFQIIKDIGDYKGDYPGVCNANDLDFYLNNCPNPNLLLKLDL